MDEFTIQHLQAFCDASVWEEDRDGFYAYAVAAVNDDPTYDWHWPSLYRTYRNTL